MTWWDYVKRTAGTDVLVKIVERTGIQSPTLSRWRSGKQGVDPTSAAQLARAYDRPVLEAFVAAGFLTEEEAKVRPAAAPDYSQLDNEELLELVRDRMYRGRAEGTHTWTGSASGHAPPNKEGGGEHGDGSPATKEAESDLPEQADTPKGRRVTGRTTGSRRQSRFGARGEGSG